MGTPTPFVDHLGFVIERCGEGQAIYHYTPLPAHLNGFGVLHGGVIMTLLDAAMASAARSLQPELGVVTLEMKTSFMRPAPGDAQVLKATGSVLHRSATLAFTQAQLQDDKGQLCAHATGTFKFLRRLPEGPKDLQALKGAAAKNAGLAA